MTRRSPRPGRRRCSSAPCASILLAQGHDQEAHATLKGALEHVPTEQQAAVWQALGEFALGKNDLSGAREAFQHSARLEPDNPQPRLALFDLALAADDEPAIRAAVDGLKTLGGPNSIYWLKDAAKGNRVSSRLDGLAGPSALVWRLARGRSCSTCVPRRRWTPPRSRAGSKRPPG